MSDEGFRQSVTQDYVRRVLEIGILLQVEGSPKLVLEDVVQAACAQLGGLLPEAPRQAINEFVGQLKLSLDLTPEDQPKVVQTLVRAIQLAQWHLDDLDD